MKSTRLEPIKKRSASLSRSERSGSAGKESFFKGMPSGLQQSTMGFGKSTLVHRKAWSNTVDNLLDVAAFDPSSSEKHSIMRQDFAEKGVVNKTQYLQKKLGTRADCSQRNLTKYLQQGQVRV
jgi:hypothetical protein